MGGNDVLKGTKCELVVPDPDGVDEVVIAGRVVLRARWVESGADPGNVLVADVSSEDDARVLDADVDEDSKGPYPENEALTGNGGVPENDAGAAAVVTVGA